MKRQVITSIIVLLTLAVITYLTANNFHTVRTTITITPTVTPTPTQGVLPASDLQKVQHMIGLINAIRKQYGLSQLIELSTLDRSASMKAQDMADHNYFSHTDSHGRDFTAFFQDAGWFNKDAENLAENYLTDEQTIQAWMNSPEHKANILQPNAIYAGYAQVGVYRVLHLGGYH